MSRLPASLLVTLCVAMFLSSLSVVAWRQGRAREVMTEREKVINAIAMEIDERARLTERIRYLESRGRVTKDASERLGLAIPSDSAIVFLAGGVQ